MNEPADSSAGQMSPWGWLVLALTFLTSAITVLGFYGPEVWNGHRSAGWPRTDGRVLEVDVTHYQGPETGHTHAAWVRYRYTVDGRTYEAERVRFSPVKERGPEADVLARAAAAFPVGSKHDVFYDPADPARACLIPGISPLLLWSLVAVAGLALAVAAWCGLRFARAMRPR